MTDIPEDELERAERLCAGINWEPGSSLEVLALAMRAEREHCAALLRQMAVDSIGHGCIDASAPHAAYRQGVSEAATAISDGRYIFQR